jgi:phospholipase/lecithinase/hemolysin
MNLALSDVPQFKLYKNKLGIDQTEFVDYADDNKHPGTKQHRLYADFILNNLKALEYI